MCTVRVAPCLGLTTVFGTLSLSLYGLLHLHGVRWVGRPSLSYSETARDVDVWVRVPYLFCACICICIFICTVIVPTWSVNGGTILTSVSPTVYLVSYGSGSGTRALWLSHSVERILTGWVLVLGGGRPTVLVTSRAQCINLQSVVGQSCPMPTLMALWRLRAGSLTTEIQVNEKNQQASR